MASEFAAELVEDTTNNSALYKVGLVLVCAAIIVSTFGFGVYLFSAIASDMRSDLGFSYTTVGTIIAVAQFGFLGASIFSSMLVPRLGAIPVVLGSTLICGLGLLLLGVVSSPWMIGAILTVLAACAASTWTPMVGLVAEHIDFKHRGKTMGVIGSGTSYGIFINGLIIPMLLPDYGWRGVWICMGSITVVITVIAAIIMLSGKKRSQAAQDGPSFLQQIPQIISVKPWLLLSSVFLASIAFISFMNYISLYVRDDLGLAVSVSGQVLMIIGAVGMVAGLATGALADKIGAKAGIVLMLMLLLGASLLLLNYVDTWFLYLAALGYGTAYVGYFSIVPAYISKAYPAELSTTIFGGTNFAMAIGAMLGNFLGGWSKSSFGDFSMVYIVAAVTAVVVIGMTMRFKSESIA